MGRVAVKRMLAMQISGCSTLIELRGRGVCSGVDLISTGHDKELIVACASALAIRPIWPRVDRLQLNTRCGRRLVRVRPAPTFVPKRRACLPTRFELHL